jgi:hypothetical protein
MTQRMGPLFAVMVFVLLSRSAIGAQTAEQLLWHCESSSGMDSYCAGCIAGFYDGRTTNDYGKSELRTCPPVGESGQNIEVTYSQMIRVYLKWTQNHPEKLHWQDWQAVRQAFADAWPCK